MSGDVKMFARLRCSEQSLRDNFIPLETQMDRLLEAAGSGDLRRYVRQSVRPAVSMGTTDSQVDLYLPLAGINPQQLNISLDKSKLTISGERSIEQNNETVIVQKERFEGEFHYEIKLPDDVDGERVEASYSRGLLHVTVKRQAESKPRKITVQ
jgi:HSP20 family protein